MALNKTVLTASIKAIFNALKSYDGTTGQTQTDAINKFAGDLADAIDTYVKGATLYSTPVDVATATMANSGGPVVAANNLPVNIT